MIIICPKHGASSTEQVSLALAKEIDEGQKIFKNRCIQIEYEYLGRTVDGFYLDADTASRYGFSKSEKFPLPDDYSEVYKEIKPICSKCFQEALE